MKNVVVEFVDAGRAELSDLAEPPAPGLGQLLIETEYTGVTNGTERHALLGEHGYGGKYPSRHGYQHVGRVAAAGDGVTGFAVGDRVFYGGYVGHRGWNVVDETDLLIGLPDSLEPKSCALSGVAGVALRSVRRLGVADGARVWIAGLGPIGHFTAQAAAALGAEVVATDLLTARLDAARAAGIDRAFDADDPGIFDTLKKAGPFDFIYDCCSAKDLLFDIRRAGLLARNGVIGATAVRDTLTCPWGLLHGTEGRIETSCHFTVETLGVLMDLYERKLIDPRPIISHAVPIEEATEMYGLLAAKSEQLMGVIFEW